MDWCFLGRYGVLQDLVIAKDSPVVIKSPWSDGERHLDSGSLAIVSGWDCKPDGSLEAVFLTVDGMDEPCRVVRTTNKHWRMVAGRSGPRHYEDANCCLL